MYVVYLNCLQYIHTEHLDCDCNDGDCKYLGVTFHSRQSIATVNITISNDTEIKCNETVSVCTSFDSRIERLTEGVTITIMDDDNGKSLTLYALYYNKMIIYIHKPP